LVDAHAPATRVAIEAFEPAVILDVAGLGTVRFCQQAAPALEPSCAVAIYQV
jgi:hypothetical protein